MKSIYSKRYKQTLDLLKNARTDAGLTQIEVAKALGQPQSFVSKFESGERRLDIVELEQIAHLYKKPILYFLPKKP